MRSPRSSSARAPASTITGSCWRAARRSTWADAGAPGARTAGSPRAPSTLGGAARPQRRRRAARRPRGRECRAERALRGRRARSTSTPTRRWIMPRRGLRSRQLYKGVLDGEARGVFNGAVVVRPGANGTDAHQTNKNLLLSDGVEVDSKPQLEIFADDVKCSHGAADGQLAADAIFYLREPRARRGSRPRPAHPRLRQRGARPHPGGAGAALVRGAAAAPAARRPGPGGGGMTPSQRVSRAPAVPGTSSGSARTSRSSTSRCTASRWSTSTTRRRRRSRRP